MPSTKHTHVYMGQRLTHGHTDGDQVHGYFGHAEDPQPGSMLAGEEYLSSAGELVHRAEVDETYRTKTGKVLTGADVDALADEAEAGYDIDAELQVTVVTDFHGNVLGAILPAVRRLPLGEYPARVTVRKVTREEVLAAEQRAWEQGG